MAEHLGPRWWWAFVAVGVLGCLGVIFSLAGEIVSNRARIDDLRRDLSETRALIESINGDRHQRTVIIQGFRDEFARVNRRLDAIEDRR